MGTQFWWFYDVLFLSVAVGVLYHAVQKGFRQEFLKTIAFVVSIGIAFAGAFFLSQPVYQMLFQEKINGTLQRALESEYFDIFENASEALALTSSGEEKPDAETLRNISEKAVSGEECPEGFVEVIGNSTENLISRYIKPHSEKPLAQCFAEDISAFQLFLQEYEQSPEQGAKLLEALYYRQAYHKLMMRILFLCCLLVMWMVFSVISSMMEYSEEQKHITGKSRIFAVLLGLIEATGGLLILTVMIRLIVGLTDGQMLLFNQETMSRTIIFRYVYHFILNCLTF